MKLLNTRSSVMRKESQIRFSYVLTLLTYFFAIHRLIKKKINHMTREGPNLVSSDIVHSHSFINQVTTTMILG